MADSIPDGWHSENEIGKKGKEIKRYKNNIGQTFYSVENLMRYVSYAKRAEVSIYAPNYTPTNVGASRGRKKQRPNPPNVRKQAEKAAAGKQRSKGLIHASNQSDEKRDNPEAASLPSELPKNVCRDKAPNSASASVDGEAQFYLSNYFQ